MDAVKNEVERLIKKELEAANEKFPLFSSAHEGYAVIKEEIEETEEEYENAKAAVELLWENIRYNSIDDQLKNAEHLLKYATNTAVEIIQVAAMAQKFIDSLTK